MKNEQFEAIEAVVMDGDSVNVVLPRKAVKSLIYDWRRLKPAPRLAKHPDRKLKHHMTFRGIGSMRENRPNL